MLWRATIEMMRQLLAAPEHGPGFQFVRYLRLGAWREACVLNAELILEEQTQADQIDLLLHGCDDVLATARMIGELEGFQLVNRPGGAASMVAEPAFLPCGRTHACGAAIDARAHRLERDARFVRLSAFKDDKRVDQKDRRLLPGSFATTLADYRLCAKCPDAPVDRYALPNPALPKARLPSPCGPWGPSAARPRTAQFRAPWRRGRGLFS